MMRARRPGVVVGPGHGGAASSIWCLALALPILLGCAETKPRTEVMLVVEGQPMVQAMSQSVEVVVEGGPFGMPETVVFDRTFPVEAGSGWPVRVGLIPAHNDASRSFRATATAFNAAGTRLASSSVVGGYVRGQTLQLTLTLFDLCIGVTCGVDMTCDALGVCVPIPTVDPCDLPPLDRDAAACEADAGPDAGSGDGGPSGTLCWSNGEGCDNPIQIVAGARHTCALRGSGQVVCWGQQDQGRLGNATRDPATVYVPEPAVLAGAKVLAAGTDHTCAVTTASNVLCWGLNGSGQTGLSPGPMGTAVPFDLFTLDGRVADVAAGRVHSCALLTGGAVVCWGDNSSGQLGDGSTVPQSGGSVAMVDVPGPSTMQLAAGGDNSCAISGEVYCWGDGSAVGYNTMMMDVLKPDLPVVGAVAESPSVLAVGEGHACAATLAQLFCWGSNALGQLGNGSTMSMPMAVAVAVANPTSLSTGGKHTCAVAGGRAYCWGDNSFGQVTGSPGGGPVASPTEVSGLPRPVIQVAAGQTHTCALTASEVYCWGNNDDGQLGSRGSGIVVVTHPPEPFPPDAGP